MYKPKLDPDMNVVDKIQWLLDNECNETGEGMQGLQTFASYCCSGNQEKELFEFVKDIVLETYDVCKEEYLYEKEQEEQHGPETAADLIWSDLCGRSGFDLDTLDEEIQKEMKESWARTIRNFT